MFPSALFLYVGGKLCRRASCLFSNGKRITCAILRNKELYLYPVFLLVLKFVIGHIARYAPSSKFQNQQKYRTKLPNLFFHHYLFLLAHPVDIVTQREHEVTGQDIRVALNAARGGHFALINTVLSKKVVDLEMESEAVIEEIF